MPRRIHVVDDEHATGRERVDRVVEAFDLAAGGVGEHEVERGELSYRVRAVVVDELHVTRPTRGRHRRQELLVGVHREHRRVVTRAEAVHDPGEPDARAGAELDDASMPRSRGRERGEQRADAGLARELEAELFGTTACGADEFGFFGQGPTSSTSAGRDARAAARSC